MTQHCYLYVMIDGRRYQVGKEYVCKSGMEVIEGMSGSRAAEILESMRREDMANASRRYVKAKWGIE